MRFRLFAGIFLAAAIVVPLAAASTGLDGVAIFVGNFNAGTPKPWAVQAANYGYADNAQTNVHFGDFYLDSTTVGEGKYAGRFSLPAWAGGRSRSQLITPRSVNAGGDDYYTLMFYVPAGWTPGTDAFWGVQIAEMNFQSLGPGGPTIALQLHSNHLTLAMQTGVATTTYPYFQFRSNADSPGRPNLPPLFAIPPGMRTGVWHELVIHCHWAADSSGLVEVWHRRKGQTRWRKTVSISGYPTLQTEPDGTFPTRTLDDIQAYRGPSFAPVTVWLDGFARWRTLAAAKAGLP